MRLLFCDVSESWRGSAGGRRTHDARATSARESPAERHGWVRMQGARRGGGDSDADAIKSTHVELCRGVGALSDKSERLACARKS